MRKAGRVSEEIVYQEVFLIRDGVDVPMAGHPTNTREEIWKFEEMVSDVFGMIEGDEVGDRVVMIVSTNVDGDPVSLCEYTRREWTHCPFLVMLKNGVVVSHEPA